jgi:hypothetical protein
MIEAEIRIPGPEVVSHPAIGGDIDVRRGRVSRPVDSSLNGLLRPLLRLLLLRLLRALLWLLRALLWLLRSLLGLLLGLLRSAGGAARGNVSAANSGPSLLRRRPCRRRGFRLLAALGLAAARALRERRR